MSNSHWKSTTVARMDLVPSLAPLLALSKERNKVVTIFDIEATTFLGRSNFGITEIGMLHINPKGQVATAGSFVNPEHRIGKDVQTLTGITPDMVRNAMTWGDGWGEAWSSIALNHIVIGFNSASFDAPALVSQHRRYEQPALVFGHHLDARKLYTKAHATSKGRLPEVADWLGIDISKFQGHRATNDAILTAQVMAELWVKFPEHHAASVCLAKAAKHTFVRRPVNSPVGNRPSPPPQTITARDDICFGTAPTPVVAPSKTEMQEHVVAYFNAKKTFGSNDLVVLASLLSPDHPEPNRLHQAISFEVSRCLDKQLIPLLVPESSSTQQLLMQSNLASTLKSMWGHQERLAPIFEYLRPTIPDINYIDLRWALDYHGVRSVSPVLPSSPAL